MNTELLNKKIKAAFIGLCGILAPLTWGGVGGGLLTSCSDFLEVESRDEILLENFWNEKADVEGILAGCYSRLQDENTVKRMMIWGEVRSENFVAGNLGNEDGSLENVLKENINALNAYTSWVDFYDVINRCNTLIEYAPAVAAADPSYTQSELQGHIAEVRALRSLCYFYLIRTFYNVPYSTQAYIHDTQQMDLEALPFNQVLDSLIADLRDISDRRLAVEYYPETKPNYQTGRITNDAVNAMLCEMYLWKQDYDNCIAYADKVIASKQKRAEEKRQRTSSSSYSVNTTQTRYNGFPLTDGSLSATYGSNYYDAGYNSIFVGGNDDETIFELIYDNNATAKGMIRNDAVALLYGNAQVNGLLAPSNYVSDDVSGEQYQVYDAKNKKLDTRAYINCISGSSPLVCKMAMESAYMNASTPSNPKSYYIISGSWNKDGTWNMRGTNTSNWVIYRLSDIMLLKAEALAQKMVDGNDPEILEANSSLADQAFLLVNAVNKRALAQATSELTDTLVRTDYRSKSQMETLVLKERHRELMFEGKRWYDLVRHSLRKGDSSDLTSAVLKKVSTNQGFIQNFLSNKQTFPYQLFWPYGYDEEYNVNLNLQKTHNPAFGSGKNSNIDTNN